MTIRAADAALNSELTGYNFLDKYVNDKLKIIRAFPVTILVVGNEISLADRKCT